MFPAQIVPLTAVITGRGITVTVTFAPGADKQPSVLVPDNEYVVVIAGDTVKEFPLMV
jgi:hypothetical protein